MKKLFITSLLTLTFALGLSATEIYVNIRMATGGTISYAFNAEPKITFGNDSIAITLGNGQVINYDGNTSLNISYGEKHPDAIHTVSNNGGGEITLHLHHNLLTIDNAPTNATGHLRNLEGRILSTTHADRNGKCQIDMGSLLPGIYLFEIDNHTFKILNY